MATAAGPMSAPNIHLDADREQMLMDAFNSLCVILNYIHTYSKSDKEFCLEPRSFYLAAMNKNEVSPSLWSVLDDFKSLSNMGAVAGKLISTKAAAVTSSTSTVSTSIASTYSQSLDHSVEEVKCWAVLQGYRSPAFIALSSSDIFSQASARSKSCSTELLVAVSWFIASKNVVDGFIRAELTHYSSGDSSRLNSDGDGETQSSYVMDDSHLEELNDESVHKYLQWLYTTLRLQMNNLYWKREHLVKIIDRYKGLYRPTTHASHYKKGGMGGSSSSGELHQLNMVFAAYLTWKSVEEVYWSWMQAVSEKNSVSAMDGKQEKMMRKSMRNAIISARKTMEREGDVSDNQRVKQINAVENDVLSTDYINRVEFVHDSQEVRGVHYERMKDINKRLGAVVDGLSNQVKVDLDKSRNQLDDALRSYGDDIAVVSLLNRYHLEPPKLEKQ